MKLKKLLLLLFTINFSLYTVKAQTNLDSLLTVLKTAKEDTSKANMLNKISRYEIDKGDYALARKYVDDALALSEKIKFKKGTASSYYNIGMIYNYLSDYIKALENDQKALTIYEQIDNKRGIANALNNIALVYYSLSDFPKALEYDQKALTINEQLQNKEGIAFALTGLGSVYYYLSDYSKALDYYQKALSIFEQLGNKFEVADNLYGIGNTYNSLSDNSNALEYYQKSLAINEQLQNKDAIARDLLCIGDVYSDLSDFQRALEYYQKELKIAEEIGDKDIISDSYLEMGGVYQKQGKLTEALRCETKALSLASEIGAKDVVKDAYGELAAIDSAMNNFRGAYENHKLFMQYKDSIFNREKDKKITTLAMKYEFAKEQDSTKAVQAQKDAIAEKELQKQKLARNGFIGGFAVMVLFAGIFFTQRNKIRKGKKRSDELLLNILPEEVAEELKAKGSADAKQFDEVTVMFTDFKGFTQISEKLSPSELVNEIHTCFKAFDNIISKHNIEKIKTIGDSYMCAGGLPVANKTHATDVVNAAMEIQQFMQKHLQERKNANKEIFEIRIGIHTGTVVAGIVGVKKFAYDIWGDTVNIASRMESSGEAGKINISGSTYELVKDNMTSSGSASHLLQVEKGNGKITFIHRGKIQAKNKGEIDMYFVEQI